jgi:nitrous oxide reductase accessory protein NosL
MGPYHRDVELDAGGDPRGHRFRDRRNAMIRKAVIAAVALSLIISPVGAALAADADADIDKHKSCKFCGMDREKWNFSRVYLEYDDGSTEGTCSIHCAAVDLALNLDKSPKTIWVADFSTRQLIDAEKAVWVLGGKKQGVMTKRAKWAFADKAAAEAFIEVNEGAASTFDEMIKGAYQDMHEDTMMIRERRAAKRKAAAEQKAQEAAPTK